MKCLIFWSMAAFGVPAMTAAAMFSPRLRGWLVSLLVLTVAMGATVSINFASMETYHGPDRGFEITLTDLIALSLALAMLMQNASGLEWLPDNTLWMGALFGWCVLSAVLSPQPLLGAFTLLKMARLYLVYWTICNCLRTGVPPEAIWRGFLLSAWFLTMSTLRQKYLQGLYRVHGPFDPSNTIPLFGNLMMPALLLWGLADRA